MASRLELSLLKAKTLQHIAFLTGLPSSGTKQRLADYLTTELRRSRLPSHGGRIVSVDMGIRNLAYCVLDAPGLSSSMSKIRIEHWKRLDVLGRLTGDTRNVYNDSTEAALDHQREATNADFSPSTMATTALDITQDLLSHRPTTILIERQRFRSGGGSAIQEWTVRVNMLESMLWACLEATRRSESSIAAHSFPMAFEASPARVAAFWTAGYDELLKPPPKLLQGEDLSVPELPKRIRGAKKSGKNDKIAVVRSWLAGDGEVALDLSSDARLQANAFMGTTRRRKRPSKSTGSLDSDAEDDPADEPVKPSLNKRDDLADCLLQGVAWYRWEQNRRNILAAMSAD